VVARMRKTTEREGAARDEFVAHIEAWPADVRRVLEEMTSEAF